MYWQWRPSLYFITILSPPPLFLPAINRSGPNHTAALALIILASIPLPAAATRMDGTSVASKDDRGREA